MFDFLKERKKVIRAYLIYAGLLILLSLFGLMFNEWTVIATMSICSLFGFVNTIIMVKSEHDITPKGPGASFAIHSILRYVFMVVGLVISAAIIYFTMGDDINKYRYLIVAISALPYFGTTLAYLFAK